MPVYGLDHSARSGLSDRLAHFAAGLCLQEVPPEVIETATWLFVNSVGVAVSNAADPMVEQARSLEPDRHHGPASLWGTTHRSSITTAAIANGIAAHISDFDDTHAEGGVHVGAVVAPALVATAEQEGASGSALLTGLIVAFEVMCRLGAAAPHRFTVRGYHAMATCGVVAVAAGTARLLGLRAQEVKSAIGIAASQAGGLLQTVKEGGSLKSFHGGWAAASGIWAARLAAAGMPGPRQPLEGEQGFFEVLVGSGEWDPHRATRGLSETWDLAEIIPKPYPCCQFLHALIDAAVTLRTQLAGRAIESVVARVPREAEFVVCEPWPLRLSPPSDYALKFSLPYVVAAALDRGPLGLADFRLEQLRHPTIGDLMARTSYEFDPDPRLARSYGAELQLILSDGTRLVERVVHPTGSAERPMSTDQLAAKFLQCTTSVLGADRAQSALRVLTDLEALEDMSALSHAVRP